jgi:peptidyl-tRNA hydrolase
LDEVENMPVVNIPEGVRKEKVVYFDGSALTEDDYTIEGNSIRFTFRVKMGECILVPLESGSLSITKVADKNYGALEWIDLWGDDAVGDDFTSFGRGDLRVRQITKEDAEILSRCDDPAQVEDRKDQTDPLIMYLVVRKSLNMSPGKIAAQCGHAANMVLLKYLREGGVLPPEDGLRPDVREEDVYYSNSTLEAKRELHKRHYYWLLGSFRKVVLTADDKEWPKLQKLNEEGVVLVTVRDAGLTEVAPNSETVMGLWPMHKSQAPKAIKRLQVLK